MIRTKNNGFSILELKQFKMVDIFMKITELRAKYFSFSGPGKFMKITETQPKSFQFVARQVSA